MQSYQTVSVRTLACEITTLPAAPSLVPTCVNGQDASLPNSIHAVINHMLTKTYVGEDDLVG